MESDKSPCSLEAGFCCALRLVVWYSKRMLIEDPVVIRRIETARQIKAAKVAKVLLDAGAEISDLGRLDQTGWRAAEQIAGVNPCSSASRRHVAIQMRKLIESTTS